MCSAAVPADSPPTPKSKDTTHIGLCLFYSGLAFRGLQLQTQGYTHETVEGILLQALNDVGLLQLEHGKPNKNVMLARACRTDRGVHAVRNLVTLYVASRVLEEQLGGVEQLVQRVNALLPPTVSVAKVSLLTASFVPRYGCNCRVYRYLLPAYALIASCDSWEMLAKRYSGFIPDIEALLRDEKTEKRKDGSFCRVHLPETLPSEQRPPASSSWMEEVTDRVAFCNRVLQKNVIGVHRFHNFSVELEHHGCVQHRKVTDSWTNEALRTIRRCEISPQLFLLPVQRNGPTMEEYRKHQAALGGSSSPIGMPAGLEATTHLPYLVFQIEGSSFLFNMIRKIVGVLLATCRNMRETVWDDLLSPTKRGNAPLAPGPYLYLAFSHYFSYDRAVEGGKFRRFRPLREEWEGEVNEAAEVFAWHKVTPDVVDVDLARVPNVDEFIAARYKFLQQHRPSMASEDAHVVAQERARGNRRRKSHTSGGETTASNANEMTKFLRSLRIHNWMWSTITLPEGCMVDKESRRMAKRRLREAEEGEDHEEAQETCGTVNAEQATHLDDVTAKALDEMSDEGEAKGDVKEDGWLYVAHSDEERDALRAAANVSKVKRQRPWVS